MIARDVIQEILRTARIEEVIGEFVQLKKKGENFVGRCPLHPGKHDSLSVSPAKGIYKCFACGNGGNVISFLQSYKQFTFVESLEWLADKYGINLIQGKSVTKSPKGSAQRNNITSHIAFIDIEIGVDSQKIQDYGAVREDGPIMHTHSARDFYDFVATCDTVCGHNIIRHFPLPTRRHTAFSIILSANLANNPQFQLRSSQIFIKSPPFETNSSSFYTFAAVV